MSYRQKWRLLAMGWVAAWLGLGWNAAAADADAGGSVGAVRTALPGTYAFVAAPLLDFGRASAAALASAGYPPRPEAHADPAAYAAWLGAVEGMQRLTPRLEVVPIAHGAVFAGLAAATSSTWSGFVAPVAAYAFGPESIVSVQGDWTLPELGRCAAVGEPAYSSTWVGIDGSGSYDVLQAGTESDATCAAGAPAPYQTAWFEWFPGDEVRVTNLPVAPGAPMYVQVWADSASSGHAYIANRALRQAVSVAFAPPPGTTLIGNSAEWVVERPLVDGAVTPLADYVQQIMTAAHAHDAGGNGYAPGGSDTPGAPPVLRVEMTGAGGQVLSSAALLGGATVLFTADGVGGNTR